MSQVQYSSVITAERKDIFAILADPKRMPEICPSSLQVEEVQTSSDCVVGRETRYRVARTGISFNWVLELEKMEPDKLLVETQLVGLFQRWHWSQELETRGQNETLLLDRIEYELPFGILGCIASDFFVKRDTLHLLESRHKKIQALFG